MPGDENGCPLSTTDRDRATPGGIRFPKECRLRTAMEFKAVYGAGKKKVSRSFVVFTLPNERDLSRFGLTTPRKLGKAPDRNRIRRRVREILRHGRREVPAGFDIVVNPRRSALDRDFSEIQSELLSLLRTVS